ncbi:hypothetical protein PYTT13_11910 [Paracoccus yeei]|uniref:Uncharacterized protein n=1 Tax=Paracoccus yeei TaxID=147645 RepID=A0A2D2C1R6_9RHOB|nr:hypothetical protein PYTT13_11910 [Paracoccus yeei]
MGRAAAFGRVTLKRTRDWESDQLMPGLRGQTNRRHLLPGCISRKPFIVFGINSTFSIPAISIRCIRLIQAFGHKLSAIGSMRMWIDCSRFCIRS